MAATLRAGAALDIARAAPATNRKGVFTRLFGALARSQMARAKRELALYRHLLPPDFELHRNLWSGREENLPFGGW